MFFGIALIAILFLFVARVVIFAFIVAAVMSILYAVFRRVKDFITYDRYGEYYIPKYKVSRISNHQYNDVEPLFQEPFTRQRRPIKNIQFIDAL